MRTRLVAQLAPSGRLSQPSAAPALVPAAVQTPTGATNGDVREMAALRSVWYQPGTHLPPLHPGAPLAQRGVEHGPSFGGPVFVSVPSPRQFQCRQRNEIPVPLAQIGAPGSPASMNTARPGTPGVGRAGVSRTMRRWARMGGRSVTAAPLVVPRWPVIGGG